MGSKPQAGPVSTGWKPQAKYSNGSPTYGRKHNGNNVSVKKAKSGVWFYTVQGYPPTGWSPTAKKAMSAFDAEYP
jgi:hypothetical protein